MVGCVWVMSDGCMSVQGCLLQHESVEVLMVGVSTFLSAQCPTVML